MKLTAGQMAPDFTYYTMVAQGVGFHRSLRARHNVLMFSRYFDCPICQLKLMEIVNDYDKLYAANADVLFVIQTSQDDAEEKLNQMGIRFHVIFDPEAKLYKLYDVPSAKSMAVLLTPQTAWALARSVASGIRHGDFHGNDLQLPASFIIDQQGCIEHVKYGTNPADMLDNRQLLDIIRKLDAGEPVG